MSRAFRRDVIQSLFLSLWAVVTLVLLAMVVLLVREIANMGGDPTHAFVLSEEENKLPDASKPKHNASTGTRSMPLFFASEDGLYLVPETRQLPVTNSTLENCRTALNALIKGPRTGLTTLLPPTATVKALYLLPQGELVINFSRAFQTEHAHFSSAALEALLVQSIVHTVTQAALQSREDPKVHQVRILIEDAAPTTLFPAHIDIGDPVIPDAQWLSAQG